MKKSAICLIAKDEPDIAEWVAHYTSLGADRLIIYDDGSNPDNLAFLYKLAEHFPIDIVEWKTDEPKHQVAAYADCIKRFGPQYEWMGFFDADEFLIPPPGQSLPQLLERHEGHDAFSLNWMIFGTSGIEDTNGQLVMEAFTHRAEASFGPNQHVKSFVRPSKVEKVLNGHTFSGPAVWTDVMGQPIVWENWDEKPGIVLAGHIVEGDWRLHHYLLRSRKHWLARLERGRQVNGGVSRTEEFFIENDHNEVPDETALSSAAKARETLQRAELLPLDPPKPVIYMEKRTPTSSGVPPSGAQRDLIARDIIVHLDELNHNSIRGWVEDSVEGLTSPFQLRFFVDGQLQNVITCNHLRMDVLKEGHKPKSGLDFVFPRAVFDGKDHVLTIQTLDGRHVPIVFETKDFLEFDFNKKWRPTVISKVDGVEGGVLKGWALSSEEDGKKVGNVKLAITCDGTLIGHCTADLPRPDVGIAHSADDYCGFEFIIPPALCVGEPRKFGVRLEASEIELLGSPVTYSSKGELTPHVDAREPRHYELRHYNKWWREYWDALRNHVRTARIADTAVAGNVESQNAVDVSILCPVYKPDLGEFSQAVESVIAQTHQNWELILVNDGSGDPALSSLLESYAKRDKRIKVIKYRKNKGIAAATNIARDAATGKYVALFDHDDVLSPVALEVMLKHAKKTNAELIYSDEDKIDKDGQHSDPAFKPDWNYRLMLSVNYVCHFVMVLRERLAQAGPFSSEYNGAQDHAMLLRLAEIISHDRIAHVSEILYSWRITAKSTAGGIGAKPYAIAAGQKAIVDHLERRGLHAEVASVHNTTWYKVNWKFTKEPKVCIIIPFREQIPITRECVARVLEQTTYKNYEIILVDNGSTSTAAKKFCASAEKDPRVRIIHSDAPFNYSALNNQAARQTDAKYLFLMNNDLHVRHSDWLRVLVDETLADPTVGIVGGKFLYPNGTVQHAGVALGIGGVAGHLHTGIPGESPGYGARAVLAQEFSAVTAAGMLINAKLFGEVGGLDEALQVAFNDIDLCNKIRVAGHKVVWTPAFTATHHESLSRGSDMVGEKRARFMKEAQLMQDRWNGILKRDIHYTRFFELDGVPFNRLSDPARPAGDLATIAPIRQSWCVHG